MGALAPAPPAGLEKTKLLRPNNQKRGTAIEKNLIVRCDTLKPWYLQQLERLILCQFIVSSSWWCAETLAMRHGRISSKRIDLNRTLNVRECQTDDGSIRLLLSGITSVMRRQAVRHAVVCVYLYRYQYEYKK